jgi:predicted TIM-barrel fold metal-dependent hydrolase
MDVHQHIWTESLVAALAARGEPPLVEMRDGACVLRIEGEHPYEIDLAGEQPARRAALVHADGLDRALIAISSPIGVEALPRAAAAALIDAHLEGVLALPDAFAAWGPLALQRAGPSDVDALLDRGCIGVSVPAGALAGPERLEELEPVLERVAALGAPLFVHPGRAPGQPPGESTGADPAWWPALTDYVSQMQAAWLTFAAYGRRAHPSLRIVFAMLAGGAPIQAERLLTRGGPAIDLHDPLTFYDTSSYGPAAVEAAVALLGDEALVYGSDRPVLEPIATERDRALQVNGARLLAAR